MIIKLNMEVTDIYGMNLDYQFVNEANSDIIATATNRFNDYFKLIYENKTYEFRNHPRFVKRSMINFRYPFSTKWKRTIGFGIHCQKKEIGTFYGDAMRCRDKGTKKNISVTVFQYESKAYLLCKVGFPKESSHYYCLYEENDNLIAIIERHTYYEDNCKATLYIENEENLFITLLACTEEIICVGNSGDSDTTIDPSAGPYISVLKEEKELFDKTFIPRVKAMLQIM